MRLNGFPKIRSTFLGSAEQGLACPFGIFWVYIGVPVFKETTKYSEALQKITPRYTLHDLNLMNVRAKVKRFLQRSTRRLRASSWTFSDLQLSLELCSYLNGAAR